MDRILQQKRLDFLYDGVPFSELACTTEQTESGNELTTVYTLKDGLKITNVLTRHGDAYEWVNWFENTSATSSGIVSNLLDCSADFPMPHEEFFNRKAWQQNFEDVTQLYIPSGSHWAYDEFTNYPHRMDDVRFIGQAAPNRSRKYACTGGRSSETTAPFFNVHFQGMGYIFAIGWSGQWNCEIRRHEDGLLFKSGIEDTNFRVLPGEKFRTSSIVIMPYEGTVIEGQNKWRRLVRKHYSLVGQPGRDEYGPLCLSVWGGMTTQAVLKRLETAKKNDLPYEYLWMDAGWYGIDTAPTPDEFEGDWADHTGDWRVSPLIHTNKLKDVADAVHAAGMKFLLWLEPERVIATTPIVGEHPEYFYEPYNASTKNRLLNLGNPAAWDYCYETLCGLIEDLGVDCYRQDFNMPPLPHWKHSDADDRRGISEIKHINGFYRLWDALLNRFPHLLIDNCASGGRRIDIETLRRSIPLWRSDYQCSANYLVEAAQCHHLGFNRWLPYSGTGSGRMYDTYRIRSAYSPARNTGYAFSEREAFGDDPEKMAWLRKYLNKYLKVRPLMEEDFYPLTEVNDCLDTWSAAQFDRPSHKDGVLQFFRRDKSPYATANFIFNAVKREAEYTFTDADTDACFTMSGEELIQNGLTVTLPEKRSSKLLFYKHS